MRAKRVDSNHSEVVAAFRKLGCSVLDLSKVGKGCPDLAVAFMGMTYLVEVKDGKAKINADVKKRQEEFRANWKGPHAIVRDVSGAVTVVRMMHDVGMRIA